MRHMNRNTNIFILVVIFLKSSTCFSLEIIRGERDKITIDNKRCQTFNANLPEGTCTCLTASPTFMSTKKNINFTCQQNEDIRKGKHIIECKFYMPLAIDSRHTLN